MGDCEVVAKRPRKLKRHCRARVSADGARLLALGAITPSRRARDPLYAIVTWVRLVPGKIELGRALQLDTSVDCTPKPEVTTGDQSEFVSFAWLQKGSQRRSEGGRMTADHP